MYAPLRCHGHHALLTGVGAPEAWLERAAELGLPVLALPEVDSLAGLVELLEAAAEGPVRPLVACELTDGGDRPGRVVALVESEVGYRNLCRLVTRRRLGHSPGEAGPGSPSAKEDPGTSFDLVQELVAHQEGLLLLADHPRLLLALNGRVEPRRLLALLSPAAPGLGGLRDPRAAGQGPRNTHRGSAGRSAHPSAYASRSSRAGSGSATARASTSPRRAASGHESAQRRPTKPTRC